MRKAIALGLSVFALSATAAWADDPLPPYAGGGAPSGGNGGVPPRPSGPTPVAGPAPSATAPTKPGRGNVKLKKTRAPRTLADVVAAVRILP